MMSEVHANNDTLMDCLRKKMAAGMANEDVPTHLIPPTSEMALPALFSDFNQDGHATVGEVLAVWARHIATELDMLKDTLYSADPPATLHDWRMLALPVENSCLGMATLAPAPLDNAKRR